MVRFVAFIVQNSIGQFLTCENSSILSSERRHFRLHVEVVKFFLCDSYFFFRIATYFSSAYFLSFICVMNESTISSLCCCPHGAKFQVWCNIHNPDYYVNICLSLDVLAAMWTVCSDVSLMANIHHFQTISSVQVSQISFIGAQ